MRWQQRRIHAYIWYVLAILIPIIVVFGLLIKQDFEEDFKAEPLNERAEEIAEGKITEGNDN